MEKNSFRQPKKTNIVTRLIVAGISLFGVYILFTQYVAYRFNYHPALGSPIYKHFYNPIQSIYWYLEYSEKYPKLFYEAYVISGAALLVIVFIAFFLTIRRQRAIKAITDLHGSAQLATFKQIEEMGLLHKEGKKENGIIIGGYTHKKFVHCLRSKSGEHALMIAPPRSGKGLCVVIPTALTWKESMLVMDLKGEIFELTAGARKAAGHKIFRFAPGAPDSGCRYNSFSIIRVGTKYEIQDVQNIATTMIDPEGKGLDGHDGHWKKKGRNFLAAAILHILYNNPEATLTDLAYFISIDILQKLEQMAINTDADGEKHNYIAAAASTLLDTPERERGGIISTVEGILEIYKDPILQQNITDPNFNVLDLMNDESPVTLYICIEPKDQKRLNPLLRILMNQIIMKLTEAMEFEEGERVKKKHELLILWDEFAAMGRMDYFEEMMAYLPGYGIRALLIVQDMSQILKHYGRDESISSLCSVKMAFAPGKRETAEMLSVISGKTTVIKKAVTHSGKKHSPMLKDVSIQAQEHQRALITADELLRLKAAKKDDGDRVTAPGEMVIFIAGQSVILGTQILYFQDPDFLQQTRLKPPINA